MNWKTFVIIALALVVVEASYAKEKKNKKITVSGYVTDVNEKPLQGVSIIVDEVQSRVFTNKKGYYKIKIKPDTKSLMAYSINHGGIEVNYVGHKKINFVLLADPNNAKYISPSEGKVYDYGYGKVSSKSSTSSIGKVEEDEASNDSYTDIYQMIKGRVPGVFVSGKSITIRGPSSIQAQGNPLFVVDGVETSSVDYLNPRDVKSISVLKGSSAAIYGSKGSLGVIVITLKKGNR